MKEVIKLMPNFIIEDIEVKKVAGFILVTGKINLPEIQIKNKNYSDYPFTVFVKAKRIGTNDFYFSKANLNSGTEEVSSFFDAALQLPGYGKNYKTWVEVFSQHDRIGSKTDEMDLTIE